MARIDLKYVQRFTDRHGTVRHYFRRSGSKRVPLPGLPGSRDFMAAYQGALSQESAPIGSARHDGRSIHALVSAYLASAEFGGLSASSQRTFRNQLDRFREKHGHRSAMTVNAMHLNAIFAGMSDRPHAAANLRKRLRRVFSFAIRLGWRSDNPVRDTELGNFKRGEIAAWTEADILQFKAHWPSGTRERLALELMLCTGQRRSDVIKMGRQHISDGAISVVQTKTGHRVAVPILPALRRELPEDGMIFLTTSAGLPFSVDGFGNWFRAATRQAGLCGKTPHGLRKAASRRLAEAGCTEKEIASITGHRTLAEVARYTRDADQVRLSKNAVAKLTRAEP